MSPTSVLGGLYLIVVRFAVFSLATLFLIFCTLYAMDVWELFIKRRRFGLRAA